MAGSYNGLAVPADGKKIGYGSGRYQVPDTPVIPFIEGDGTGRDIWKASVRVFNAAVEKAYKGKRHVVWYEVFAGEKAKAKFDNWRPVKYYRGVPSPVKHPERMDVVIYRENTEDVYAGIEWEQGTAECAKLIEFLNKDMLKGGKKQIRLDSGVGIKPISVTGTKRLVRMAIRYALETGRKTVTLMHKGNIQKFTEGAFRKWGYELATEEFRDQVITERESWIIDNKDKNPNLTVAQNAELVEPGMEFAPPVFRQSVEQEVKEVLDRIYSTHGKGQWKNKIMINDRIADSIFQQVVTRADEYSVLATPNLNGDYISDACAAQVGGLGIAPGANIGDGYAIFEATHGTAPKYADKDVINPGSVILSGVMMFRHLGWIEAADLVENALERTIEQKKVTYDFERLMEGATKVKTSEFATCMIENMSVAVAAD